MSSYSDLILAHANLSAYYRLGESSGTTLNDSQTSPLNGTYSASGITYSVTGAIANDATTAISIAGAGQAEVGDDAALDLGDGPLSIEFWVKRGTTGTTQGIVSKAANGSYQVRFNATTNVIEFVQVGVGIPFWTSALTDTSNWHHVVFTKDGATRHAYLDGVDVTVLGTNLTLTDTAGTLYLGATANNTNRLNGSLDEVAIYKGAALTAAEVLQHYRTGKGAIALTDSATATDAQVKSPVVFRTDSVTTSESRSLSPRKAIADSVGSTDATGSSAVANKTDTVTASDALSNSVGTTQADSVTLSDSETAAPAIGLGDSVTTSDALTSTDAIVLGDTATLSDQVDITFSGTNDYTQDVADSVTLSDEITPTHVPEFTPSPGGWVHTRPRGRAWKLTRADLILLSDSYETRKQLDPDLQREEDELLLLV